jgi:hypothetical protein
MSNECKTPSELLEMLTENESAEIAVRVYAEASAMEDEYIRVKEAAKARVEALLPRGAKVDIGIASAGWTQPKARWLLDKDAWEHACQEHREFSALVANYEAAQAAIDASTTALTEAQKHYQRQETPPSRFFIRTNPPSEQA